MNVILSVPPWMKDLSCLVYVLGYLDFIPQMMLRNCGELHKTGRMNNPRDLSKHGYSVLGYS